MSRRSFTGRLRSTRWALWSYIEAEARIAFAKIRGFFFSGLIFLLPFVVTIFVLLKILQIADDLTAPAIERLTGSSFPGLGILITILFVIFTGLVARKAGEGLFNFIASFFMKIPLARWLITTTKEISDFVVSRRQVLFRKTVFFEYPRKGIYSIGFEVVDAPAELNELTGEELVSVFVPTTPNPTSGLLVFLPKKHLKALDMSVDTAMKVIISGGIITRESADN